MSYRDLADLTAEGRDMIDSRDVIKRIEELEEERDAWDDQEGDRP